MLAEENIDKSKEEEGKKKRVRSMHSIEQCLVKLIEH